jgi:hypothetical protein
VGNALLLPLPSRIIASELSLPYLSNGTLFYWLRRVNIAQIRIFRAEKLDQSLC